MRWASLFLLATGRSWKLSNKREQRGADGRDALRRNVTVVHPYLALEVGGSSDGNDAPGDECPQLQELPESVVLRVGQGFRFCDLVLVQAESGGVRGGGLLLRLGLGVLLRGDPSPP